MKTESVIKASSWMPGVAAVCRWVNWVKGGKNPRMNSVLTEAMKATVPYMGGKKPCKT